ncbi:MAG: hypothetical protein GX129_12295 [Clostridiales bacterium]|jgi:DNA-binding NarL/FixJ family response regulator|nr:hypothetical protein [Clostridiales bacterium]
MNCKKILENNSEVQIQECSAGEKEVQQQFISHEKAVAEDMPGKSQLTEKERSVVNHIAKGMCNMVVSA